MTVWNVAQLAGAALRGTRRVGNRWIRRPLSWGRQEGLVPRHLRSGLCPVTVRAHLFLAWGGKQAVRETPGPAGGGAALLGHRLARSLGLSSCCLSGAVQKPEGADAWVGLAHVVALKSWVALSYFRHFLLPP